VLSAASRNSATPRLRAMACLPTTAAPVSGAAGGLTYFVSISTAGNGTVTNNGGVSGADIGATEFQGTSTAGAATLIANGGTGGGMGGVILFANASTGGTARVEVSGNGNLDISFHSTPGMTIGSIEGTGNVFLGANNLTVGSNNLTTTFSGVIQDGGLNGGTGGSLTKIGTGTLSLTNSNTYTGGTWINAGTLIAGHDGALGAGNVSLTASGVTLTLQNGATQNYIADSKALSYVNTDTINVSSGTDVIAGLIVDGVPQAPGLYGAGGMNPDGAFTGEGFIDVVPEPSPWTMMGLGVAMLAVMMRFRRRRS
jgi:autotransporter-associated beta strand protein